LTLQHIAITEFDFIGKAGYTKGEEKWAKELFDDRRDMQHE